MAKLAEISDLSLDKYQDYSYSIREKWQNLQKSRIGGAYGNTKRFLFE